MMLVQRFLNDEGGATAIEYGLIVAVLSLAIVSGVGKAADSIQWLWSSNESKLAEAFASHGE